MEFKDSVEKWEMFEVSVKGKSGGNPYKDYKIFGIFTGKNEKVRVEGFYNGNGIYKVRFMPSFTGMYTFVLEGTFADEVYQASFYATEPSEKNHGPVRVANTYHFVYEDGTPYYPIGTTCYVWELQRDEIIEDTLKSLEEAGFNKLRFCIWPKHYDYNLGEPRSYPYEGSPMDSTVLTEDNFRDYTGKTNGNNWDFFRFNSEHFEHIEKCIELLQDQEIEADLIIMHPYDRWGFSQMTREEDELYWNYVIARFAAYRNVWWSLANEYDLLFCKRQEDWEAYAKLLCEKDIYGHLRSIHNCRPFYDYSRPWITHCSIQRQDLYKTAEMCQDWRKRYKKPVVVDEMAYEGNLERGWGNITGQEMVRRFWEAALRGGYPGHGETYWNPEKVIWWSHGGKLHGESWKRVKFWRKIIGETPGIGLKPEEMERDDICAVPEDFTLAERTGYRLYYYSFMQPLFQSFFFDNETEYKVQVIDTWNMTIENAGIKKGKFKIKLPGKPYMLIRIEKFRRESVT